MFNEPGLLHALLLVLVVSALYALQQAPSWHAARAQPRSARITAGAAAATSADRARMYGARARRRILSRWWREIDWPPRHGRAVSQHRRRPMASIRDGCIRSRWCRVHGSSARLGRVGRRARHRHDLGHAHRAVRVATAAHRGHGLPQRSHLRRLGSPAAPAREPEGYLFAKRGDRSVGCGGGRTGASRCAATLG